MIDEQVRSILLNAITIYLKSHLKMTSLPTPEDTDKHIKDESTNATLKATLLFLQQVRDTVRIPRDYFQALREVLGGYQGGKLAVVYSVLQMNSSSLKVEFETAIKLAEAKHEELCDVFMKEHVVEYNQRLLSIAVGRVISELQKTYMKAGIAFNPAALTVKMKGDLTDLMVFAHKEYLKFNGVVPCPALLTVLEGYHQAHESAYACTQQKYPDCVEFYEALLEGAIQKFHNEFYVAFDAKAAFQLNGKKHNFTPETKELLTSPLIKPELVKTLKRELQMTHLHFRMQQKNQQLAEAKGFDNVEEANFSGDEADSALLASASMN